MPLPPPHAHTYDALRADSFATLEAADLESLLRQCVESEVTRRRVPDWNLGGPPAASIASADLRLELLAAAPISRADFQQEKGVKPLTYDDVGRPVVYSAKSGETWEQHALEEAKELSGWAVEALVLGGRLVVVTSRISDADLKLADKKPAKNGKAPKRLSSKPAREKKTVRRKLADLYLRRLQASDPNATDPVDRIDVYDANDLLQYLRNAGPSVSKPLLMKLGVTVASGLQDVSEWFRDHEHDRAPAPGEYVWDDERASAAKVLIDTLQLADADRYDRAVWLASPPGVGKTRFVVEALRKHPAFERRTYVARSVSTAPADLRALIGSLRDAIVVVDDCPEDDVDPVYRAFGQANKDGTAGLIIITATAPPSQVPQNLAKLTLLNLAPMATAACVHLIEQQLGQGHPRARAIADLSEGYPWFAILVAHEAYVDGGPAEWSLDHVVDLALSSRVHDFRSEVARRVAALFVVMLCEGEVLQDLDEDAKDELVTLFDTEFDSWTRLWQCIEACKIRGLVRAGEGGTFRYVTPAILEREIASRVLGPPTDPGGRKPLQDRLQSIRMSNRLQALRSRLERLGLPQAMLSRLALPVLGRLDAVASGIEGLRTARALGSDLLFAAHHQPVLLAETLRRHIEATSIDDLRSETRLRRPLMFALASLAGRRSCFEDAEAALFRLACAENEGFVNNATAAWAGLFDVAVNTTYRPFDEKLPLLESRVHDPEPAYRLVALAAPARLVAEHGFKLAGEELDGPYPRSTRAEVQAARVSAWSFVLQALRDANGAVRAAAAQLLIRHLRSAVRSDVFSAISGELKDVAALLTEVELRALRKAVEDAERYDRRFFQNPEDDKLWASIRESLAPRSFADRLHQEVGTFGHASTTAEQDTRDQNLARIGLGEGVPVLTEVDWLASAEAVRSIPFGSALGLVDDAEQLLAPMMAKAVAAPDLLSSYLQGREQAGRAGKVDAAIEDLRRAEHWDAAALSVWRAGASPARVAHLCEDVEAGRVSDRAVQMLAWASWQTRLSEDELERFVRILLARGEGAVTVALDILEHRVRSSPEASERFSPLLLQAFEAVSLRNPDGQLAFIWERAAKLLVERGHTKRVAQAAVKACLEAQEHLVRSELVNVLRESVIHEPLVVWDAVRPAIEADDAAHEPAVEACRASGVLLTVPIATVSKWIGPSIDRATLAASMVPLNTVGALSPLARWLISRFGPRSRPAAVLMSSLHTTPRAVASIAQFTGEQLTWAQGLLTDTDPRVREFAEIASRELASSRDQLAAHEEYQRRRWGT